MRASAVSVASSSSEEPPSRASMWGPCAGAGLGGSGRAGRCSASAASGLRRSMRSSTLQAGHLFNLIGNIPDHGLGSERMPSSTLQ